MLTILVTSLTPLKSQANEDGAALPERPTIERPVPVGREVTVDGQKYWAYTLEEYQEIGAVIVDYRRLFKYANSVDEDVLDLKGERNAWKAKAGLWETTANDQKARGDTWYKAYTGEHDLRLKMASNQRLTGWIPWTVTAVVAVVFTGIAAYAWASAAKDESSENSGAPSTSAALPPLATF
jgi:hypothetical protein